VDAMKKTYMLTLALMLSACVLLLPGIAASQGSAQISVVALDPETFITVQEVGTGDMISFYKVKGERIYLVDTVFNSTSRDPKLPKRYLHHVEVDNR
jgi:starvation-inducible outer membrane lipoprotein